jgi:hypothetical protein
LAVRAGAVAIPFAPVTAVIGAVPLNTALGPVAGAANVTVTPLKGFPLASFTNACGAVAKVVFTAVLCVLPAAAVTLAGAPAVFARLKLAGVATPATLAVIE